MIVVTLCPVHAVFVHAYTQTIYYCNIKSFEALTLFLSSLCMQSHDSSDSSLVKVLHWGAAKKLSNFPSTERLVELGAQQIVPSDGQCLVLTGQGTVVSLSGKGPREFTETVSRK